MCRLNAQKTDRLTVCRGSGHKPTSDARPPSPGLGVYGVSTGPNTSEPMGLWRRQVVRLRDRQGTAGSSHRRRDAPRSGTPMSVWRWCRKRSRMGSGRIGAPTSLRTAKGAGVTFRLRKNERKRWAALRRAAAALTRVTTLRGARDMRPRLVKPKGESMG